MNAYDAIVVGAGVNGASAAYHLAKERRRVLLLEQFPFGHTHGSSHGESRIFRFAYAQRPYTRLAMQALPLWRTLEAESGEQLLLATGGIDIATDAAGEDQIQQVIASINAEGCRYVELDGVEAARRFPPWRLPAGAHLVYSPDTAVLHADAVIRTLLRQARVEGADLRDREPATRIVPHSEHVDVHTPQGSYRAGRLIVAAGAWTNILLGYVGIELPLRVTQEQTVYFQPRANTTWFTAPAFPVWIHHLSPVTAYGFPILPEGDPLGRRGIKAAFHADGPVLDDVSGDTKTPRPEVTRRLQAYLTEFLPDAAGEAYSPATCLYTSTPDENFIIDRLPGYPHIAVGSACSGHGFKFGIATGKALADIVTRGETTLSIAHCRLPQP